MNNVRTNCPWPLSSRVKTAGAFQINETSYIRSIRSQICPAGHTITRYKQYLHNKKFIVTAKVGKNVDYKSSIRNAQAWQSQFQ